MIDEKESGGMSKPIKCLLALHEWGPWQRVIFAIHIRECQQCGHITSRKIHT